MTEVWRKVPSPSLYSVSSIGRVRSEPRSIKTRNGQLRFYKAVILKQSLNNKGYPRVWVRFGTYKRHCLVHCLVASAFLGPRPVGHEVAHNDGVASNPDLQNLRYETPVGNSFDKRKHGTHLAGDKHPQSKLTQADVAIIKSLLGKISQKDLADRFGVQRVTISAISTGRSWPSDEPTIFSGRT